MVIDPHTNPQTHRQDRLQCTAPQLARSVNIYINISEIDKPLTAFSHGWLGHVLRMDHQRLGSSYVQERTRPTKNKLERRNQERSGEDETLPGKKFNQQLSTDKNGVGVWPNASNWMRDVSRSSSRSRTRLIFMTVV